MAVTELHRRLDYLVAYSSQLIFVSGESLAKQQKSLQTFISSQHENTEIAFLNGEEGIADEQYRQNIYQQLVKSPESNYNQPLNQLLGYEQRLNGQVLICICAAEHISQGLLQELWDLVIYSRNCNYDLHLNVILFGQTQWANQAKQWLPHNNQERPILLSNEVVIEETADSSELEQLIATKRAQFAQRIAKRHQQSSRSDSNPSVIHTLWFKLLISAVFVITFATLFAWQYPQTLAFLDIHDPQPEKTANLAVGKNDSKADPQVQDQPNNEDSSQQIDATQAPTVQPLSSQPEQQEKAEQRPVTTWQDEIKRIEESAKVETQATVSTQANINHDTQELAETDKALQVESENTATATPAPSQLDTLLSLSPDKFVVQLSAMSQRRLANQFVIEHELQEQVWQYTTHRFGGDWHVIVYAEVFDSIAEGQAKITLLLNDLKTAQPFVKSVKQIQEEIALADK